MKIFYKYMDSIVGKLKLVAQNHVLIAILWENEKLNRVKLNELIEDACHPLLVEAEKQLLEYFNKKRKSFELPLKHHGTPFQSKVWEALKHIPYGTTLSYGQLAKEINHPRAVRALGAAIGRNPLSIVIPCHRVIGTNGKLTGFAGGLEAKRTLLKIEDFPVF